MRFFVSQEPFGNMRGANKRDMRGSWQTIERSCSIMDKINGMRIKKYLTDKTGRDAESSTSLRSLSIVRDQFF